MSKDAEKQVHAVKEAWITEDNHLMAQLKDKRQVMIYAEAVDLLEDAVARDHEDGENDFPGVPVVDEETLNAALRLDHDDAVEEVDKIFEQFDVEAADLEGLKAALIEKLAEPPEED